MREPHVRRMTIAIVLAAALIGAQAPVGADQKTSFASSGHCIEYGTGVAVDAARARALVPEGFVLLDVAGRAVIAMFAMDCTTSIDTAPAEGSIVGGVFVFVDPVASPAGCQTYDFFWHDEARGPWSRALRRLGWPVEEVEGSLIRQGLGVEAIVPSASAPWSSRAYTTETAPPVPLTSVHCTVGSRGLVRATYTHALGTTATVGAVTIGDGPLWHALGAQSTVGHQHVQVRVVTG